MEVYLMYENGLRDPILITYSRRPYFCLSNMQELSGFTLTLWASTANRAAWIHQTFKHYQSL